MPDRNVTAASRIETRAPTLFTSSALVALYTYGLLLAVPVLLGVVLMSLLPIGYGPLSLPFIGLMVSALILPVGLGNPHIARLVRRRFGPATCQPGSFIVQVTLAPRLLEGFSGVLEDADDFGWLRIGPAELAFEGDRLRFSIPGAAVTGLRYQNVGLRGLFIYGARVVVSVGGMDNVKELHFADRSSWLLPGSRRQTRELLRAVEALLHPDRNALPAPG